MQLKINGQFVDLGSAKISLQYVNNMLSSIDKISRSHSFTITLPLTAKNDRIFGHISAPGSSDILVGRYLPAEVLRDGVCITSDALAYITGISAKGISVAIIWDTLANVTEWRESGLRLSDLPLPDVRWMGSPDMLEEAEGALVYEASYNQGAAGPRPPVVNAGLLFEYLMNTISGGEWGYDVDGMQYDIKQWALPLLTRTGAYDDSKGGIFRATLPTMATPQDTASLLLNKTGGGSLTCSSISIPIADQNFRALRIQISGNLTSGALSADTRLHVRGYLHQDGRGIGDIAVLEPVYEGGGTVRFSGVVDFSDTGWDTLRFELKGISTAPDRAGALTVIVTPAVETASPGDLYNPADNLPEMTQADFMKAMLALYGASIIRRYDGSLRIVSLSQTFRDIFTDFVPDWTPKVVNMGCTYGTHSFSGDGYALTNWLKWKEDKTTGAIPGSDGAIRAGYDTLKAEATIYTMPFAASGSEVPLYKVADGGAVELQKLEPRLLRVTNSGAGSMMSLGFPDEAKFPAIIARWYGGLAAQLQKPRNTTIYARLSPFDLSGIQWALPVYLGQTGQYYAIKSIKADNGSEICEVELIQI